MFKLKKISDPKKGYGNFLLGASSYAVYDARLSEYLTHKNLIPDKYSQFLKRIPDSHVSFCICAFIKELFVFGGIRGATQKLVSGTILLKTNEAT